jgi:aerobic carbon-monoxide dehydrogenase large subunit
MTTSADLTPNGSVLGNPVRRREDPRLLTGQGRYVDDVRLDDALFALFVRSTVAHARIGRIDTAEAAAMPGVVAIHTDESLGLPARKLFPPIPDAFNRPHMARDAVRFVGEPVAVVVAETRAQAADAAEAVLIDYEQLAALVDVEAAARDEVVLFPEAATNHCYQVAYGNEGDALEGADVVVRARFVNQRLAPAPMEPNAVAAAPDPDGGGLVVWMSSQMPFMVRDAIADSLGIERSQVRGIAPDVGGGFGAKAYLYPEQVVTAVVAWRLGRPVRWLESRSENLVNMCHGRGQVQEVELGARSDGTLVGLRVRVIADTGAYPGLGAWLPTFTGMMLSGVYHIPRIDYQAESVVTSMTPIHAYRGAGRPEAAELVERAMDMLAGRLRMDPVEVRRRNFIAADAFPLKTVAGAPYDSGEYARALDRALEIAGYDALRQEQARRRARGDGKLLGIGVSVYVEVTGGGAPVEFGSVEVRPDGRVLVLAGTSSHGQGHETTYAQLVAELLQMPMERIEVLHSDTARVRSGQGTVGSRSMQMGGAAIEQASREVIDRGRALASELLEADAADLEVAGGGIRVRGVPGSAVSWADLASQAGEAGLVAAVDFRQQGFTFPFGAHVAVVEVDSDTGDARLLRHVAVDDCGKVLNPLLAEGQQQGGIAQGVAQALFEEVVYDTDGNPRTSSLLDYAFPTANELPRFETDRTVTPTHLNVLGVKGIGESGTVGSTPAVHNAVLDALALLGIEHLDMPLSPEKLWRAIQEAPLK